MLSQSGTLDDPGPSSTRQVLVADDEPMIRKALRRVLEKRGHQVTTAPDAATAVELLNSRSFDAVLADARMPGDGLTILRHLDEMDFDGVRVLMTGGLDLDAPPLSPGVHLLEKPFRFAAVIPLVEGEAG